MKRILSVFIIILIVLNLDATHIVGGEISYKSLGNKRYEVTFKIYRDCIGGQAPFDGDPSFTGPGASPFTFVVFDNQNGSRVDSGDLNLISKDTVISELVHPCLSPDLQKSTCVEVAVYKKTILVPDDNRWYTIVHQRCCRNNLIDNLKPIVGGNGSNYPGMTIYAVIPPVNSSANNSAVFKKFPPLFLCNNQSFTFDHSATDADGDLLKYYIVNPLDGASANNPVLRPYEISNVKINAAFQNPFNLSDVMGGTPAASIDENTGLLTCKPRDVGRYVVSIMVKEFRAGVCIDSLIRDFQFNVKFCDLPNADLIDIPGSYDPITKMFDYKVNCKNKTINFQNSSTNADSFFWNFGEPTSGTKDTSTQREPSHEYADTGVYIITLVSYKTMIDKRVCTDTLKSRVRIYPFYFANFTASTSPKCPGELVSFTDNSVATFGQSVKWFWDFGNGKTDTARNPNHRFDNSGVYNVKLTATSSYRCVADTTIPFKVQDLPNIMATIPSACIGQPFRPVCNVTVPAPATIASVRWTLPDRTDNNCATSYTPPNMNNFSVRLWGQSNMGCQDSQTFNLTVRTLPIITTFEDTFICYDSKINLDANGGVSYAWTPVNLLDNPNIKTPVGSPIYPNPSRFVVTGTDAFGCYNFDSVLVSFRVKPFIDAGKDTNICLNPGPFKRETVMLTGLGTFQTFFWTPSVGLDNPNSRTPIAKPAATTDYVFNGIDQFNCQVKDTVRVIVLDPSLNLFRKNDTVKCSYDTVVLEPLDLGEITRYEWSPLTWIHSADIFKRKPRIYNRDTFTYTLTIDNYCYRKSESIRIDVIPSPKTNLPLKDSTCYGTPYQFNLNTENSYRWSSADPSLSHRGISNPTCNPKATEWYYITATNSYGCTIAEGMELIVNYPPNVTILNKPKYICLGDSAKMTVLSNYITRVRWSPGRYLSDSLSKEVYYFPPKTEELELKVLTAENCFTIEKLKIPVQLPIKPNVESPVHFCKGGYKELYASGGFYYLWKPYYNITDTLSDRPQVYPDSSFRYIVRVANDCFFDTMGVQVIMDSLPVIHTTPDTSIYRGAEIELTAETSASRLEWYPISVIPSNPMSKTIRVSPKDTTLYYVKAIDGNGCIGYDSVRLGVYSKNVLLIPTAFSPNGDGVNDVFKIAKHLNVKTLNYFEVYNRWGQKVFSTTDINQGWDGSYNGDPVPNGVYSWQLMITNYDNEKITQSGSIDIIR